MDQAGDYPGFGRSGANHQNPGSCDRNDFQIAQTKRRLLQELGREPLAEEIAIEMGTTVDKIRHIQKISQEVISLVAPVDENEEDLTLSEFIKDEKSLTPSQLAAHSLLKEKNQ